MDLEGLMTFDNLIAFLTLTSLEIVLGIDNVVFIAILVGKLEPKHRDKARLLGLGLAMGMRILLLLTIGWIMGLTAPIFTLNFRGHEHATSWKDLILLAGGAFLVAKATYEIHDKIEGSKETIHQPHKFSASMQSVIIQILLIDIVFSLDSVITAVGMAKRIEIMVAAVIIAVIVMMIFSGKIAEFIQRHPTLKVLALAFLILIGVMLVAEGFHQHISKGYIYSAMTFSLIVEMINLNIRGPATPAGVTAEVGAASDKADGSNAGDQENFDDTQLGIMNRAKTDPPKKRES